MLHKHTQEELYKLYIIAVLIPIFINKLIQYYNSLKDPPIFSQNG